VDVELAGGPRGTAVQVLDVVEVLIIVIIKGGVVEDGLAQGDRVGGTFDRRSGSICWRLEGKKMRLDSR